MKYEVWYESTTCQKFPEQQFPIASGSLHVPEGEGGCPWGSHSKGAIEDEEHPVGHWRWSYTLALAPSLWCHFTGGFRGQP